MTLTVNISHAAYRLGSDTLNGTVSGTGDPSVESNVQVGHEALVTLLVKETLYSSGPFVELN